MYIVKFGSHQAGDLHYAGSSPNWIAWLGARTWAQAVAKARAWGMPVFAAQLIDPDRGVFLLTRCLRRPPYHHIK